LFIAVLGLVAFYFTVLKPQRARMNSVLLQGPDLVLKPELDAEETALHEVDRTATWLPEIDGRQAMVFEMAALEEVASEMGI
jgi:hypothetical protein